MEVIRTIIVFAVIAAPALIAAYIMVRWFEASKHTPRYRV
jgi:hypothetical protein